MESHCYRRVAAGLLFLLGVCGYASERKAGDDLPDGTTLVIQLEQDVRAETLKPGDEVQAQVIAPAMMHSDIAIPVHARITGVVVNAEPLTSEHPSRLVLVFRHAHWPNAVRTLNAYVTRHLVIKHSYALATHPFCAPWERHKAPQARQAATTSEPAPAPMPDADDCHVPLGTQREDPHPLTFTSPAIVGVVLRKLNLPKGAVALESLQHHVLLRKGMMLEIRHSAE